jgi:tetratricopeptide (TPR) repeat protein
MVVLERSRQADRTDPRAPYYLGNLLYDKNRGQDAIKQWKDSCQLDSDFPISWRNLGIASYNILGDHEMAIDCYEKAFAANPEDARLLYELDQLRKRLGMSPKDRLADLERQRALVLNRDDLTTELVTLLNLTGRPWNALDLITSRRFHPWEGGEGLISTQYVEALLQLGQELLGDGDPQAAIDAFEKARHYPENLGEAKHLLTPEVHLDFFAGLALRQAGRADEAAEYWRRATGWVSDLSTMTYYSALAMEQLGDSAGSRRKLTELLDLAGEKLQTTVKIDYFATSLPNFLIFEDNLEKRNRTECLFLQGLGLLGLGRADEARAKLGEVLSLDAHHLGAAWEMRRLPVEAGTADER